MKTNSFRVKLKAIEAHLSELRESSVVKSALPVALLAASLTAGYYQNLFHSIPFPQWDASQQSDEERPAADQAKAQAIWEDLERNHVDSQRKPLLPILGHILSLDPSHAKATAALANRYFEEENYRLAIHYLNKALELEPSNAFLRYRLGRSYQLLGRIKQSFQEYSIVLKRHPEDPLALNRVGSAYADNVSLDKALKCFDDAIAVKKDFVEAYNNRGVVLISLLKFDEARSSFKRALSYNPSFLPARNNLEGLDKRLQLAKRKLSSPNKTVTSEVSYRKAEAEVDRGRKRVQSKQFIQALPDQNKGKSIAQYFAKRVERDTASTSNPTIRKYVKIEPSYEKPSRDNKNRNSRLRIIRPILPGMS